MRKGLMATMSALAMSLGGCAQTAQVPRTAVVTDSAATRELVDYVRSQKTTGFIIMVGGRTVVEQNFPPSADAEFRNFVYESSPDGALFEDVASQQKSFVSMLAGIAIDRRLIDPAKAVTAYIGPGWSKATAAQEAAIRVEDLLRMSSGLDDKFRYVAPAGTVFFYNTPVYAVVKRVLVKASGRSLDDLTREWLTSAAGMNETTWRERPAALAGVGNSTGLVTTPRDTAIFGAIVAGGGVAPNGRRIVSRRSFAEMFAPSPTNPAYGRLWWLNSGDHLIGTSGSRREGRLIPSAPADLVAALGALDRKLYVVPSLDLVVVRMGATAPDSDFDEQLWKRLRRAIG